MAAGRMTRRQIQLLLIAAVLLMLRRRLVLVVRFIRELYEGGKLMRKLPGPGKEFEGFLFGHVTGPLMGEPGMGLDPEYMVEHIVDNTISMSKQFKHEGLFRGGFRHGFDASLHQ
jgi:hypothetical protein